MSDLEIADELVSIREASRRLLTNPGFISRWVSYGWIPVVSRGPRGAKMIPLKRAALLVRLRQEQGRRGRRLIPRAMEKTLT